MAVHSFGSRYAVQASPAAAAERIVDFVYQPLQDAAGQVTGIFVEAVDVTERKLAEAAPRQLNETLEQRIKERSLR